ncbi:MAG: hypothetical protein ABEH64_02105 [Salinirussus sp.]
MDDSQLSAELDAIKRRLWLVLALVVGLYVLIALTIPVLLVPAISVWHALFAGLVVAITIAIVGVVRRRRRR